MNQVFSVSQINQYIRRMLERDVLLSSVMIRGEVSNLKYHTSGHIYFSLKDGASSIACVMFSRDRRGLAFRMQNGDAVIVSGSVEVYARDGKYQLYAREIRKEGAGELYERFAALLASLRESGMFDPMYKVPVPAYSTRIGIVTAPTGAAIRDIEQIARRRNPFVQLILYPALVEGNGAKESIVRGIEALDRFGVDVIIVGRGGGSLENLWAFNEECVARAIFNCRTPVISAVGHETDTTISDYVADLRAKTPSEAAELAVFDLRAFLEKKERLAARMRTTLLGTVRMYRQRTEHSALMIRYGSPERRVREYRMKADGYASVLEETMKMSCGSLREKASSLEDGMKMAVTARLAQERAQAENLSGRMKNAMADRWRKDDLRLRVMITRMKGLSPLDRLRQGFSYVTDAEGHALRSIAQVNPGDPMTVSVKDGKIHGYVSSTEENQPTGEGR